MLVLFCPLLSANPGELPAEELRERWDDTGHLTTREVYRQGVRVETHGWIYDADGRPVEKKSTFANGIIEVERWTYDASGRLLSHQLEREGVLVTEAQLTWEGGRQVALRETEGGQVRQTRFRHDAAGRLIESEVRDQEGALLSRALYHREPAAVPVLVRLDGGLGFNSDVQDLSMNLGFDALRKPTPNEYAQEPLELHAYAGYRHSVTDGELVDAELRTGFGIDYNELLGPVTVFFFADLTRNPAANLNADLYLAPAGAKVDLYARPRFATDLSLAPVWNYRSVDAVETCATPDGACVTSVVRASFRLRLNIDTEKLDFSAVTEYLPSLTPTPPTLRAALDTQAILRETLVLALRAGERLSVSHSLVFTRDPLLALQADCSDDAEQALCRGLSVQTTAALGFKLDF